MKSPPIILCLGMMTLVFLLTSIPVDHHLRLKPGVEVEYNDEVTISSPEYDEFGFRRIEEDLEVDLQWWCDNNSRQACLCII